jgi:hypothetical protein
MTRAFSAIHTHAARIAVVVLALLTAAILASGAAAGPSSVDPSSDLVVSLVPSATAVPITGTMGFSGIARFPASASSVQARLQVRRSNGQLVYQRTQYLNTVAEGTRAFPFARPLEGLALAPGTYPAMFSLRATIDGSDVATSATTLLRVYDPSKQLVPAVLLVKVHALPLGSPNGSFSIDPASVAATRARDEIDRIASIVLGDPSARVVLAVPPVMIEEWRRFTSLGYTLASGTVVPASDPTPVAYATTLTRLEQALSTGRLELVTMGYSDPNLADLSANKLSADAAVQYDTGLSAFFASLETTPSGGSAPAGGVVPTSMKRVLLSRQVTYAFVDGDRTRIGKRTDIPSGAYPMVNSSLIALVVDARASKGLESGDASATVAHTFDRVGTSSAAQPFIARIDLDDTVSDATATVGFALTALENTPWVRLALGKDVRAPKAARAVSFKTATTKNTPSGFWSTVRRARSRADGMIAMLPPSDDQAVTAQTNSLIAESAAWSEPSATWPHAKTGLAFASAVIGAADSLFKAIKLSAPPITLPGSTGNVALSIQNSSNKTLTVIVVAKTSGRVRALGNPGGITVKLAPRETFVPIPIDMQDALYGKVAVQVMAGRVVVAQQTVPVRRSYLDRLALVGGVVIVLGGMLGWIVLRVRRSPDIGGEDGPEDDVGDERYTKSHSDVPRDSD